MENYVIAEGGFNALEVLNYNAHSRDVNVLIKFCIFDQEFFFNFFPNRFCFVEVRDDSTYSSDGDQTMASWCLKKKNWCGKKVQKESLNLFLRL